MAKIWIPRSSLQQAVFVLGVRVGSYQDLLIGAPLKSAKTCPTYETEVATDAWCELPKDFFNLPNHCLVVASK